MAKGTPKQDNATKGSDKIRNQRKIRLQELGPFTDKLAAMLDAGLPLIQCLDALITQVETEDFQRVLKDIKERVEGGDAFSEALSQYDFIFGELYVSMIQAGEMGGSMAEVTQRLASYLEASMTLRRKIKGALAYPVVVIFLATVLTMAMLLFIVPVFAGIYQDFEATLPPPTRALMFVSEALRNYFLFVAIGVGALIFIFKKWKNTPHGSYVWAKHIRKVPIAGGLIEKIALARMARTFASLLRSGVPILKTLNIVATATGNQYIGSLLKNCGEDIEGGENIATSMEKQEVFPNMVLHMIAAGERTGDVDGMLEKVADYYESEVSNSLDALSSMIEPLLMAFIGIVVGSVVVCMFMPIFKMHEIVSM